MSRVAAWPLSVGFFLLVLTGSAFGQFGAEISGRMPVADYAYTLVRSDKQPSLATDEAGTWIVVWNSYEDLNGIGSDGDIVFSRSVDNGVTWTSPLPVNLEWALGELGDDNPRIATDGSGNWVVVWRSIENPDGSFGPDLDLFVSHSPDNGLTWSTPESLASYAREDDYPENHFCLAADDSGVWLATWSAAVDTGGAGTDGDIFVARSVDGGASWSEALLNTTATTDNWSDSQPSVEADSEGNWIAVWTSMDLGSMGTDPDIVFARSTDGGLTWSAPQPVNTDAATDGADLDAYPDVATDGAGNWLVTWHGDIDDSEYVDLDILAARSGDLGGSWSDPVIVNSSAHEIDDGTNRFAVTAADPAGNWISIWMDDFNTIPNDTRELYISRSTDGGLSWTDRQSLNSSGMLEREDKEPALATDGFGNWTAVWSSSETMTDGGFVGWDFDIFTAHWTFCPMADPQGLRWIGPTTLGWDYTGGAYDLMFGDLAEIGSLGAGLLESCLAQGHQQETLPDPTPDPVALSAARCWFFLVRAASPACDDHDYGADSEGISRTTHACP